MDLVVSWLVGVVSWFVLHFLATIVVVQSASPEQLSSFDGAVLWYGSTGFVAYLAAAALAGLAHRSPQRRRTGRNALAALGVPVAVTVVNAAALGFEPDARWGVFLAWSAVALVGAVAGWLLVRALRSP